MTSLILRPESKIVATFVACMTALGTTEYFFAQEPITLAESRDLEILGRGPIHEAFAQPAAATPKATVVVKKKPPEPIDELPPDTRPEGANVSWIPGYWAFDEERSDFIWVSGFWRNVPPGMVWTFGYWTVSEENYSWAPGYWSQPVATQVYYPPPPEPVAEALAPAPNEESFFVAGTWIHRDSRYQWRPGYWSAYRPGWLWTHPRYTWTPSGYVFADGYWDHDFSRRGVLFAPAYFGSGYWDTHRSYSPAYALATDSLVGSLFIQPNANSYYFGDYYAPSYARLGFTPWIDYRHRGFYADPAWLYYRWQNRDTPRWEEQMRASYAARQRGESPVPPRRFNPQSAPAQTPPPASGQCFSSVNLVVPIQNLQLANNLKLQKVAKDELANMQRHVVEARSQAETRQKSESKLAPPSAGQQPTTATLPVPRAIVGAGNGKAEVPPAPHVVPALDPQPKPLVPPVVAPQKDKISPPPQLKLDPVPAPKTVAPPPSTPPVPKVVAPPPPTPPAPKAVPPPPPPPAPKTVVPTPPPQPVPKVVPPAPPPPPKAPPAPPPPPPKAPPAPPAPKAPPKGVPPPAMVFEEKARPVLVAPDVMRADPNLARDVAKNQLFAIRSSVPTVAK